MPYKVIKKGKGYTVKNTTTGKTTSKKAMTKSNAEKQKKLLDTIKSKTKKKSGY